MHFFAEVNCKKYLIPVWGMVFCAVKKCRATYPINKKNAPKGAFSKTLLRVFLFAKIRTPQQLRHSGKFLQSSHELFGSARLSPTPRCVRLFHFLVLRR